MCEVERTHGAPVTGEKERKRKNGKQKERKGKHLVKCDSRGWNGYVEFLAGCYQGDLRVLCEVCEEEGKEGGGNDHGEGGKEWKWLPTLQVVPPVGRVEYYRWSSSSSASRSEPL